MQLVTAVSWQLGHPGSPGLLNGWHLWTQRLATPENKTPRAAAAGCAGSLVRGACVNCICRGLVATGPNCTIQSTLQVSRRAQGQGVIELTCHVPASLDAQPGLIWPA